MMNMSSGTAPGGFMGAAAGEFDLCGSFNYCSIKLAGPTYRPGDNALKIIRNNIADISLIP